MSKGIVWVQVHRASIQIERFLVSTKIQLGVTHPRHPDVGIRIAWTDAQCFKFVALSLLRMTVVKLDETNQRVGGGKVRIQHQRSIELFNSLGLTVGLI